MDGRRQLEELAVVVHGSLATLHLLGLLYNLRRRNVLDSLVHGAAALYDINAVRAHVATLGRLNGSTD